MTHKTESFTIVIAHLRHFRTTILDDFFDEVEFVWNFDTSIPSHVIWVKWLKDVISE